jgi:hypothetical protein
MHDKLPYSTLYFFAKLGAFNVPWQELRIPLKSAGHSVGRLSMYST